MARPIRRIGSLGAAATLVGGSGSTLLLALASSPAGAVPTTWTVDTLADGAANAADCAPPTAGSCSLRDALAAAAPGDTVQFAPSLFTGGAGTITLTGGRLADVGADVIGPGSGLLTVDADGKSSVFEVTPIASGTTVSGMTITGGYSLAGGVLSTSGDPLTLRDTVVTGNQGTYAGGVYALALTLVDSVVSNNVGGYLAGGVVTAGHSTIRNSTISGNSQVMEGSGVGGVMVYGYDAGLDVVDSTISGNSSVGLGGGILIYGTTSVLMVANSTITGNSAPMGGGIQVAPGNTVMIGMSTITGNSATNATEFYSGGGIHLVAGDVIGDSSVASFGSASVPGSKAVLGSTLASRGRIPSGAVLSTSTLTMIGAILAGNTAAAGGTSDLAVGGDSYHGPTTVTAVSSMIGTGLSSNVTIAGTALVRGDVPMLGPLANNGGRTPTMLPLAGSPVLDAGPTKIPDFPGNEFDQRGPGFLRIVGTTSDIGAVEVQAPPAPEPVIPAFTG